MGRAKMLDDNKGHPRVRWEVGKQLLESNQTTRRSADTSNQEMPVQLLPGILGKVV